VARKKTLLLINGDQVLMDINKRILERAGYSVNCAFGLSDAREHFEGSKLDGIILANSPPDGHGLDYLCEIRKSKSTPVVFVSDNRDDEVVALQAGANDFLKKPYDFDVLITRIELMLGKGGEADPKWRSNDRDRRSTDRESEAQRQHPFGVQGDAESELLDIVRVPRVSRFQKIGVACIAAVLLGSIALAMLVGGAPAETYLPDEQIPLMELPFLGGVDGEPHPDYGQTVEIYCISGVELPAGATELEMPLHNPGANDCFFVFEIILKGTGETLYTSDYIAPGTGVGAVGLSRGLEAGDHDAVMKIHTYESPGAEPTYAISVEFVISAF
jgi:CheY-like chemotaxis protein